MEIKEGQFIYFYKKDHQAVRGIIKKVHPYGFFYRLYGEDDKWWYNVLYSEIEWIVRTTGWRE